MRFFKKKFSDEQKETLQRVAGVFNRIGENQEKEFLTVLGQVAELVRNCTDGQRAGLGRPSKRPPDGEVERVQQTLLSYMRTVESSKQQLAEIVLPDWAPPKFSQARQDKDKFYETHQEFLELVLRGLGLPDPLVDQLGEAKLNMFLSGLGLAKRMVQHHSFKL